MARSRTRSTVLILALTAFGWAAQAVKAEPPDGSAEAAWKAPDPEIVELGELAFVGIVDAAPDVGQLDIGGMWERFTASSDSVKHTIEGVGYEFHAQTATEPPMHFCLAGVRVTEIEDLPDEMFAKVLPPCTYAVFTHRVVDGYAKVYERIGRWLASSPYEEAHPYDFELYDSRFKSMDDPESLQDIYVPVRPK
jgi:AraC family transcriptional regulator